MGRTIQQGARVQVTKIMFAESDQHKNYYNHLIGELGWVAKTDGHLFEVVLDEFADEGYKVFFQDELQEIDDLTAKEGACMPTVSGGVTFKEVLKRRDMTAYEKLVYVVVYEFAPVDLELICTCLDVNLETARHVIAKLMEKRLVTNGVAEANLFWPTFSIQVGSPCISGTDTSVKKKDKKKETTWDAESEEAKVLLFLKQIEKYYHQRGVKHHISNKGKKYIKKAVSYLEKIWKERADHPELAEFELLEDIFYSYIEYTFKGLVDNELNHLKRLTFAGTKGGWRAMTKNTMYKFNPYLIEKSFTDKYYFGIPKNEIPEDPVQSGYHTTLQAFLFSKWKYGNYPISPQILYALESYIIYKLFRKQEITDLKAMHKKYLEEYKLAEARGTLDNLQEYVNKNKKRSDYCHDCGKKGECELSTKGSIVELCSEKV